MSILGVRWSSLRRAKSKQKTGFVSKSSKHIGSLQAASSELTKYPHLALQPVFLNSEGPPFRNKYPSAIGCLCGGVANESSPLASQKCYCDWSTNGDRERHIAGSTEKGTSGLPAWFPYTMFKQ